MTTVRPILYTEHPEQWLKIMTALGGEALVDQDGWALVQLDHGRVAFHSPMEDYPKGQVDLCLEVEDLDEWAEACGTTVEDQPFGRAAKVSTDDGMRLAAHAPSAGSNHHDDGPLSVMPIWVTPDVEQARKTLKTAGLRERIASDSGAWVDFQADSGLVAIHGASESTRANTVLGFEYDGDVNDLVAPLKEVGADPVVIDETFGRTLQFADPDGGERIWINQTQTDLYGYSTQDRV
uniref:hypothetical protein n=1 Tax=Tessaracoccus timonensis TaxID=2161816 RepID=UPI000D55458E|nr:hypothetical protein [Tessaracoccus timonensis]